MDNSALRTRWYHESVENNRIAALNFEGSLNRTFKSMQENTRKSQSELEKMTLADLQKAYILLRNTQMSMFLDMQATQKYVTQLICFINDLCKLLILDKTSEHSTYDEEAFVDKMREIFASYDGYQERVEDYFNRIGLDTKSLEGE